VAPAGARVAFLRKKLRKNLLKSTLSEASEFIAKQMKFRYVRSHFRKSVPKKVFAELFP